MSELNRPLLRTEVGPPAARMRYSDVDPELRTLARVLPKSYAVHKGLSRPRAVMNLAGRIGRVRGVEVARVNADVTVRIHRRATSSERGPAMLWIHGGATLMGSATQDDRLCRKLVNFTDVTVVAVEHRLAPEHPFPTPLEDCYAAFLWLTRQPWVDSARVAVGGASAGGGFAAAITQLALDRGDPMPTLQLLTYPMLDDRTGAGSEDKPRVLWAARDNRLAWQWYLAGADPIAAVPARRPDLEGLAPTWIGVGTLDLFYEECLVYGDRLRQAGVPVHEEIAEGAFHGFDQLSPNASVSQRFFASQCRAIRAAIVDV